MSEIRFDLALTGRDVAIFSDVFHLTNNLIDREWLSRPVSRASYGLFTSVNGVALHGPHLLSGAVISSSSNYYIGVNMLSNLRVQPRLFSLVKASAQKFEGSSRRAINYFPSIGLSPKSKDKLAFSNEQPILPQLIGIEAAKLSGCIKMESRRFKSRAAVLIYKGQVIACVYGSKAHPEQVFGTDGYVAMMSEISSVHSDVSSYVLDE